MNKKIKIALIGCGNWGKNIARNLLELGSLACIYDPASSQAKEFMDKNKLPELSLEEILLNKGIKGVIIASPAETHREIAIQAIENNKDVLIEKPFCLSLKDAKAISDHAIKKNSILMIGHLLNYHNVFIEMKKQINEGKIGSIKNIRAHRLALGSIRQFESVIYDLTAHDISMVLAITKELPTKILAHSIHHNSNIGPDAISVKLSFQNGITVLLNSDWMCPYKEHRFSIIGTKGSLIFDDIREWDDKLYFNPSTIKSDNAINLVPSTRIIVKKNEPLKNELKVFIDAIQTRKSPITNYNEAIGVQTVMEMIENKLKNNQA